MNIITTSIHLKAANDDATAEIGGLGPGGLRDGKSVGDELAGVGDLVVARLLRTDKRRGVLLLDQRLPRTSAVVGTLESVRRGGVERVGISVAFESNESDCDGS